MTALRLCVCAVFSALVLAANGCAHVAPYDRERLAHETMSPEDLARASEAHVRAVQEGAVGGDSALGGGLRVQLTPRALVCCGVWLLSFGSGGAAGQTFAPLPATSAPASSDASQAGSSGQLDVRAAADVAAYADSDHVYVLTPSLAGSIAKPTAGWRVGGSYLVDAVSAASVDIVSTASQHWRETRHAGSLNGTYKPGSFGLTAQAALSSEPDYLALSASATAMQDLLDQNVTVSLGLGHSHEVAGRSGTPFSVFARTLDRETAKLGLTLVLDPATLALFGFDVGFEHGDPSKPYRYIPLFEPGVAVPRGASIDSVNMLRISARPLEQLPLTRDRFALSGGIFHRFGASTLRVEERMYSDTWAMLASTTDARWLIDWGRNIELGPHVRLHGQKAVSFWQRAYRLGAGLEFPSLRTGDRELGPLLAATLGLTIRLRLGPNGDLDRWRLGLDVNTNNTWYLDDLYVKRRVSAYSALSLEARL